jgi:hypothetical protein
MASRDVLKVSALHYKDASKTDEEFEKHVNENINPAWVKLVKRHEVMKYTVVSKSLVGHAFYVRNRTVSQEADLRVNYCPSDLLP